MLTRARGAARALLRVLACLAQILFEREQAPGFLRRLLSGVITQDS